MRGTPRIKFVRCGCNVVSISVAQIWFKRFKSRNFSVKDEVHSDALSQIKSVTSLREWSKIDI